MSTPIYLLSLSSLFGTILLVFGMRAFSAIQQAKVRVEREESLRQLAEKSLSAESEHAAALRAMSSALADVQVRLAAIEKMLKEVG